jgi:hypothetical protein
MNCGLVYTAVCQQQDAWHRVHQALCIMRTYQFFWGERPVCVALYIQPNLSVKLKKEKRYIATIPVDHDDLI